MKYTRYRPRYLSWDTSDGEINDVPANDHWIVTFSRPERYAQVETTDPDHHRLPLNWEFAEMQK